MSKYTLLINIQSEHKEFLDNLMVTLETINGDIDDIDSVELLTVSGPSCIDYCIENELIETSKPTISQRNLFLDKWSISESF